MAREAKWIEIKEKEVTIDMLIALLEQAKEEFGGDTEIQAMGCYQSLGEILAIGRWEENDWYNGVILDTDVCSG
jgi:hypothetical protein